MPRVFLRSVLLSTSSVRPLGPRVEIPADFLEAARLQGDLQARVARWDDACSMGCPSATWDKDARTTYVSAEIDGGRMNQGLQVLFMMRHTTNSSTSCCMLFWDLL